MRKIEIGSNRFTEVFAVDEPSHGGASHEYRIFEEGLSIQNGNIKFQKGPVKEHGVNGCFHEDLIAIVIDRLQSFQNGDFACRENSNAIIKLEEALHWLNHRTNDRQKRGVEGTFKE